VIFLISKISQNVIEFIFPQYFPNFFVEKWQNFATKKKSSAPTLRVIISETPHSLGVTLH